MTTVRHETVHYTAEEMTAKEAAEAAAKAKKRKTRLIICGVSTLVLVFSCIACLLVGSLAPDMPVTPTPSKVLAPEEVVEPTPFPTPAYLTVASIEQERKELTSIQKEQYDQGILGEVIQFHGQVVEVSKDGKVSIDEGGAFTTVQLLGIPKDVAITFTKGHLIEGVGTVADVDTFLVLMIEIQVTSWND